MLCANVVVVEALGFFLGECQNPTSSLCKLIESVCHVGPSSFSPEFRLAYALVLVQSQAGPYAIRLPLALTYQNLARPRKQSRPEPLPSNPERLLPLYRQAGRRS